MPGSKKIKGGKCYDKVISKILTSHLGMESIPVPDSLGKEASLLFNPTQSEPLLEDCISAFGHAH